MKKDASCSDISNLCNALKQRGLEIRTYKQEEKALICVIGDKSKIADLDIKLIRGVENCVSIDNSYKLVNRQIYPSGRGVKAAGQIIGKNKLFMIAGPCSVESESQLRKVAAKVKESGASFLRGGAYKVRTSPYSFQGLKEEGYKLLRKVGDDIGLKIISEVTSEYLVDQACKYCDMLQIGARNMQNFSLLKEVGRSKVPVLLKRGMSATIDEWLDAAEYIMSQGNYNIVLCERGIRTFETSTRNTLDISSIPVVKEKSYLPIIVDPSHAAGKASYVKSLACGSIAAGADGLMIEVHPDPSNAKSDSDQQVTPDEYCDIMRDVSKIAKILGRSL